jgi:hypothetical protein
MLTFGEVQTGLLQHSGAVSPDTAQALLGLIPGEPVRSRERPLRYAWSPDVLTGIDCQAPNRARRVRMVGTTTSRLCLTGGQILQSSTMITLEPSVSGRRRAWSYYLARPGVAETIGSWRPEDLAEGFLADTRPPRVLDLSALNRRLMATVQGSELLDRTAPFAVPRTRMRWAAVGGSKSTEIAFVLGSSELRTVRLRLPQSPRQAVALCCDLARHDWLLTTLLDLVDRALLGQRGTAERLAVLRLAVDHLVHLWMPAVDLPDDLRVLWAEVDAQSAVSRQWQQTVDRVRDQIAISAAQSLQTLDGFAQGRSLRAEPANT